MSAIDLSSDGQRTYPGVDPHADTDRIVRPGELGGIHVAVAPVPSWILLLGTAAAMTLIGVAVCALGWLIAMGLDALFFAAGQWSGK